MIKFRCDQCDQKIGVEDAHAGRKVKCPICAEPLVAPGTPADGSHVLSMLRALDVTGPIAPAAPRPSVAQTSGKPRAGDFPMYVLLGVLVLATLLALILGNTITKVFFTVLLLTTLNGYWLGAAKVAAVFGGMLVSAVLAVPLGKMFEGAFTAIIGTTGVLNRVLSTVIVAGLVAVVVSAGLQVLISRLVKQKPAWQSYDRKIGSGLGLLEGTLLGFVFIWAVVTLEAFVSANLLATQNSAGAARSIISLAESARASMVGQAAASVNPLSDLRLIRLLNKGLQVLNDETARTEFVNHPAIERMSNRSSVELAMVKFTKDPEIMAIVGANEPIAREDIYKLLRSQTVLNILDTTNIAKDLTPMADDIEQAIDEVLARAGPSEPHATKISPRAPGNLPLAR